MTLVKTGEGQDGLVEREVSLDGGPLVEETFIREGEGSAFVSRPNVLVLLTATERGLPHLQKKVEQLIGRGFHNVAVTLKGMERVDEDDWGAVKTALAYADQFAGWVPICGASPGLRQSLEAIARKEGRSELLSFVRDRAEAKTELRRRNADEGGEGVDPLVVQSGDTTASAESSEDDWGGDWGSAPAKKNDDGLPEVDIAELLVEADELPTLRDKLHVAIKKGKKYFTLRLHFRRDRRMTSEDMHALVAARDAVARAQGQLVLAALQEDVLKWLRLLGEDRHFTIADTADDAEVLHRRHGSGQTTAPTPVASDAGAPFTVVSRDASAVVVRPTAARGKAGVKVTTAPARVVSVTREGLPGLGALLKRLAGEGVRDVIVDLGAFKEIRGERFDSVPGAVDQAKKAGVRVAFGNVAREVRALLKILGVSDAAERGAAPLAETIDGAALYLAATRPTFEELRLELTSERLSEPPPPDPVSSVDLEPAPETLAAPTRPAPARVDDGALQALRAELATAKAGADRAAAERDAAKRRLQEVEGEREAAKRRAQELEANARRDEKRALELEQVRERAERKVEEQRAAMERARQELETRHKRMAELELAVQAGDQELEEARRELEATRGRAQQLEGGASQAQRLQGTIAEREQRIATLERELEQARAAGGEASALESALTEKDGRIAALQEELERAREAAQVAASAGNGDGAGDPDLLRRVAELERENVRILAEAQDEIQRLMKEQQLLREELESAGDMIERLGKELEYS